MISSPIARGNGAYIVHKNIEQAIKDYQVKSYHSYRTLFPPSLWPLVGKIQPDIIHTTPDYASFHNRKNVPLVLTFHGYVLDAAFHKHCSTLQKIHYKTDLRWFTKKAVKAANVVTAVSQFTANLVQSDLGTKQSIEVIYNGIDEQKFKPIRKSKKAEFRVLYSGNLSKLKGVNLLPMIADKLNSNIKILYTSGLRRRMSLAYHPRMENIGHIAHKDMAEVYQSVDLLVSPTIREGFGLGIVEAMACGLPIVATDSSSIPELVSHNEGGYLCDLGKIEQFADRINELAESPVLCESMGEYNRNKVEKQFTSDRMINEYKALFERVLTTWSR